MAVVPTVSWELTRASLSSKKEQSTHYKANDVKYASELIDGFKAQGGAVVGERSSATCELPE